MSRYHEEQHCHGALMGLLLVAMVFVVVITVVAVVFSRPGDALLLAIAPVVIVLVASLISLSHLDVDATDRGVSIAFRYLWPTRRIGFAEIVGLEVRRYNPLLEYGGWGVRLGPKGWGYMTSGTTAYSCGCARVFQCSSDRRGRESSRPPSARASRRRC